MVVGGRSKRGGARWAVIGAALAVIAAAVWLLTSARPEVPAPPQNAEAPAARPEPAAATAAPEVPSLRIAEGGRLSVSAADLSDREPLALALEIGDEARGEGDRSVRVVSVDGRRLDALATPLPGAGAGVRLDIEPGFLREGRYLIEIDTVDHHPLRIRRFVLEVK